jgi:hypothetical protein
MAAFVARLEAEHMACHETDEDVMRVFVPGDALAVGTDQRRICQLAQEAGVQVRHLKPSVPTLEDVFARAVGEP